MQLKPLRRGGLTAQEYLHYCSMWQSPSSSTHTHTHAHTSYNLALAFGHTERVNIAVILQNDIGEVLSSKLGWDTLPK
jgi:hypothetical protein